MDEGRDFPLPVTQDWAGENHVRPVGRTGGVRPIFLTIATPDRAAQSRIFARSARECHPDARLVVLVPGAAVPPRIFEYLFDLVITAEQLALGGLADMRFRYSIAELCFALKPWAIRHLFDRFADDPIYYFDSDIELFTPLAEAEAALAHGANLVLTPHILQRGRDQDRERALLRSGSFNAGFLAVAPSVAARAFVAWWCERVRTGSTHDPLEGTYGDQKWLELAPSICDGVTVLRHPGYNFAYWNAHERKLSCHGGVWSAAGRPLRFVHYSQWNLRKQDCEQYLAGYFPAEPQPFAELFAEYQDKVREESRSCEGQAHDSAVELGTPSRIPVPALIRSAYARHAPAVDGEMSEVLAHAVSVLGAPSTARADLPDLPLTVLCDEIWQLHADLRFRFVVDRASGRVAFLRWLVEAGAAQLAIPAVFLGAARSAVERERIRVLEAADEAPDEMAALSPPIADLSQPELPTSADALASLIAEGDRIRLQQNDIRLLVSSNKGLRREVQSLRVRRWRDEETIQGLEKELAQTGLAHEAATRRGAAAAGATLPRENVRPRFVARLVPLDPGLYAFSLAKKSGWRETVAGLALPAIQVCAPPDQGTAIEITDSFGRAGSWLGGRHNMLFVTSPAGGGAALVTAYLARDPDSMPLEVEIRRVGAHGPATAAFGAESEGAEPARGATAHSRIPLIRLTMGPRLGAAVAAGGEP